LGGASRVHLDQVEPDMLLEQINPRARRLRLAPLCRLALKAPH
jgi:hypothetical protein